MTGMVAISAALVIVALLAWDGWRREVARKQSADKDAGARAAALAESVDALTERVAKLEANTDTHEKALKAGINEMRALLAPVRGAILKAVPDGRKG